MAEVVAVCISEKRGTRKHEVPFIDVRVDHGIEGDAHAGTWHRQISLLAKESVDTMQGHGFVLAPGDFAENIQTVGIAVKDLPVGTRLAVGPALLEVTQIGKQCHNSCEIRRLIGTCVMPTEGIFAKVLRGGRIKKGDPISVVAD